MNLREKYKDKKVFITGITGFKGSWLALLLNELGAKVYGLGLPQNNKDAIFHQAKISEFAGVFYTDIRHIKENQEVYTCMSLCDYVFHLAAQPLVKKGYENPIETFETNTMGTLQLLEILSVAKDIKILNITTDKVYKPKDEAHKEDDVLQGYDPYSLSKSFADMIANMYRNVYYDNNNITLSSVRAGNVIGGGDFSDYRIVTDIMKCLKEDTTVHLRHPESTRPYQYVLDCLIAYLYILAFGDEGDYNVGPVNIDGAIKTEDLVNSFKQYDNRIKYINDGKNDFVESKKLDLCVDKLYNNIKELKPPYANTLDKLTKVTYDWYNNLYKGNNMVDFSRGQVQEILHYYET